jgi:hypothetical protein
MFKHLMLVFLCDLVIIRGSCPRLTVPDESADLIESRASRAATVMSCHHRMAAQ